MRLSPNLRSYTRTPYFWVAVAYGPIMWFVRWRLLNAPASEAALETGASSLILLVGFYVLAHKKRS